MPCMPTISWGPTRTGLRRIATAFAIAKAQNPPRISVRVTTSGIEVWYGAGALWNRVINPTAIATNPERVSAPCEVTCASTTSSVTPSSTSVRPAQESGSTEKPKSAHTMQIAPNAPGITTPGWNSSKPSPAMPARKSRPTMFGSISVERKRVKKPGRTLTISAPEVCKVRLRGTVLRPSIVFSRAGSDGASRSMTFICSASCAVRFDALRTARSAQAAFRPCVLARPRSDAAASFTTLRRRSLEMFVPLPLIGVDDPMFVSGAIARMSAASEIQTPADAARAPPGET